MSSTKRGPPCFDKYVPSEKTRESQMGGKRYLDSMVVKEPVTPALMTRKSKMTVEASYDD
jgi:hypothetical protein